MTKKPTPRVGQEWLKRHNDGPSSPPTHIRIVEWQHDARGPELHGFVESRLPSGKWGRRRRIFIGTLRSAYACVKEAPDAT
jgi:hypothetical protein